MRARLGAVDKTLYAIGDRSWRRGVPTEPEPFTEMPIVWERAFGGPGFAMNPVGKGAQPIETDTGEIHPLPNIELPETLITSPTDQPAPAGFGPIDIMWPQRFARMGTYDQKWLEERFPGFAEDTDLGLFNAAPEDQQIQGFFRGDEPMVLENMHPERPVIEAALPGIATRAFINRKGGDGESFSEVPMRLETVHLFPHAERGVLLFRGIALVDEDDAADVLQIVIGAEALGEPRPVEHYRDVLARRLDPKAGHLAALRESDLLPPLPSGARPPRVLANAGYPNAELEATLADPALDERLAQMEAQALEGYRQTAHFGPAAGRLAGEAARRLRDEVIEAHRAGRSLAGRDLTGADLSGLDLRGAILLRGEEEHEPARREHARDGRGTGQARRRADPPRLS